MKGQFRKGFVQGKKEGDSTYKALVKVLKLPGGLKFLLRLPLKASK